MDPPGSRRWRAGLRRAVPLLATLLELTGTAATYHVINTSNAGPGSLNQAITDANTNPGEDEIRFNIPPGGAQTILLSNSLPAITDPVIIDAATQPGFAGKPLIELTGATSLTSAFVCMSSGNTVRGFVINHVFHGVYLYNGSSSNRIEGNWIGLNNAGTVVMGVNTAITIEFGTDNVIGGTNEAARNVIAGSTNSAISIYDGFRNRVEGNYLGTDPDGMIELGNGYGGVNGAGGVLVEGGGTNTIGGSVAGAGNLISGNYLGVALTTHTAGNVIQGNRIGLNASGTAPPVGRAQGKGVMINTAHGNIIGGTAPGAGNVVSGHASYGIQIYSADNTFIQGNRIGTDATGLLPVSNQDEGILLYGASRTNTIGGTAPGAGNVISANGKNGIYLRDAISNLIQGNFIGVAADGISPLGNGENGVFLHSGSGNSIGGTTAGAGNVIAFNGTNASVQFRNGVTLTKLDLNASSSSNPIRRNSIFENAGRGILLYDVNCTSASCSPHNDANDADHGPNDLQNTPVLTNAATGGGTISISGMLHSSPNTAFSIEFFANPLPSPTGYGEGKTFIGTQAVVTDGSGNASISAYFADAGHAGRFISATATDAQQNTSEFAAVIVADGPAGALQFEQTALTRSEGAGSVLVKVVRLGGTNGAASVNFTTTNGTALAGSDYEAASGTVHFAAGQTSQNIVISLLNDNDNEPDESFSVVLHSPSSGVILAAATNLTVTIADDDPIYVHAGDAAVTKPVSGTTLLHFPVILSQPSPRLIRVNYATANVTAQAGADYLSATGTLEFDPGVTNVLVPVTILADGMQEGAKAFLLTLNTPTNVTLGDAQALGTIYDGTQGTLQFSAASYAAPESAGLVTITVTRVGGSIGPVSVAFNVAGGSATAGSDFCVTNGLLNFNSGQTTASFAVPVVNDSVVETNETVLLHLDAPTGTSLGMPSDAFLIIEDDDLPVLAIAAAPGACVLSWPSQAAHFQLLSAPVLSGGQWAPVTNPPVAAGGRLVVTNAADQSTRFYRLLRMP